MDQIVKFLYKENMNYEVINIMCKKLSSM